MKPWLIGVGVVALVAIITIVAVSVTGTSSNGSTIPGLSTFAENDHQHVTTTVTYDHNPPAGGAHDATPLNCGIYASAVRNENAVHSMEHGSVWITYRPNLPSSDVLYLRTFVQDHYDGTQRYLVLSPYPGIPSAVVASTWGAQIKLTGAHDPRLLEFVNKYIGGGQGGEKGAECTGGIGAPIG